MSEVKIPTEKDRILALGEQVVKQNPAASKTTKVAIPKAVLKTIRDNVKKAAKALANARNLRKKAEAEQKKADRMTAAVEKALRDAAQVLKRQVADAKELGEWGFTVDEGSKCPANPAGQK